MIQPLSTMLFCLFLQSLTSSSWRATQRTWEFESDERRSHASVLVFSRGLRTKPNFFFENDLINDVLRKLLDCDRLTPALTNTHAHTHTIICLQLLRQPCWDSRLSNWLTWLVSYVSAPLYNLIYHSWDRQRGGGMMWGADTVQLLKHIWQGDIECVYVCVFVRPCDLVLLYVRGPNKAHSRCGVRQLCEYQNCEPCYIIQF